MKKKKIRNYYSHSDYTLINFFYHGNASRFFKILIKWGKFLLKEHSNFIISNLALKSCYKFATNLFFFSSGLAAQKAHFTQ